MNRFKTVSILAFALCTFAAGGAPAATPDEEVRRVAVHYADLDLTSPIDEAVLQGRIERAAEYVCGPLTVRDLQSLSRFNRCKAGAVDRALTQVRPARLAGRWRMAHNR